MGIPSTPTEFEVFVEQLVAPLWKFFFLVLLVRIALGKARFHFLRSRFKRLIKTQFDNYAPAFESEKRSRPVIIIVTVVFTLSLFNFVSRMGGELIPGHLYTSNYLAISSVPVDDVAEVWAQFPDARYHSELDAIIELKIRSNAKDGGDEFVKRMEHWGNEQGKWHGAISFLKFVGFVVLVLGVALLVRRHRRGRQLVRLTSALIIIIVLIVYCGAKNIEAVKQQNLQRMTAMNAILRSDPQFKAPNSDLIEEKKRMLDRTYIEPRFGISFRWSLP